MADPFSHTLRSLSADSARPWGASVVLGGLLLAGWVAWLVLSSVSVYAVSAEARVETAGVAHRVEAPIGGRVTAHELHVGREVAAGEVLVELDATGQSLELAEVAARIATLESQRAPLDAEIRAKAAEIEGREGLGRAQLEEAKARWAEARAHASLADEERSRAGALARGGVLSAALLERRGHEAEASRAAERAAAAARSRIERETETARGELIAELERVRLGRVRLDGDLTTDRAAADRLRYEMAVRQIVAPIAGRIGEASVVHVGSVLAPGAVIATIVPNGVLRAVSNFEPSVALGRIGVGQPARLRLHGFSWMQYGFLDAVVERVAEEERGGRVRVEMSLAPRSRLLPHLRHGLPATAEIEVERVRPATLLLRSAGAFVAGPPPGGR